MRTFLPALGLLLAAGCAEAPRPRYADPSPRQMAERVGQLLGATRDQVKAAVASLDEVVRSPEGRLPGSFAAFSQNVSALQVSADETRLAAMDLSVRRDEYLEQWIRNASSIQNPELREQAERRRAAMAAELTGTQGKGETLRHAFAPLMSSLQDCRIFLKDDLQVSAARGLEGEVGRIRAMEAKVLPMIEDLRSSLNVLAARFPGP
jgi:hypothetical protein